MDQSWVNHPLHEAIIKGKHAKAGSLLSSGFDADSLDEEGYSSLVYAIMKGDVEGVRLLLQAGADPDFPASNGIYPLHVVVSSIASTKHLTTLIKAGASLESRDIDGNTPLMGAVIAQNHIGVTHLLKLGANPNSIDNDGLTALMKSVILGDLIIAETLLENGADFAIRTPDDMNAMDYSLKLDINTIKKFAQLFQRFSLQCSGSATIK